MAQKSVIVSDRNSRIIWIDGRIDKKLADKFSKKIKSFNKKCAPIFIYIKGPGGDAHAAFQIMNDIENSDSPVATIAHDYVASACFLITQAGNHKLALPGTTFGFHRSNLYFKRYIEGIEQSEVVAQLDRLRLVDALQLGWFLRKGRPTKEVFDLFHEGARISLSKAKKLNLIDDYYKKEDFLRDRRLINGILKAKR
jgi:hypothetical protein